MTQPSVHRIRQKSEVAIYYHLTIRKQEKHTTARPNNSGVWIVRPCDRTKTKQKGGSFSRYNSVRLNQFIHKFQSIIAVLQGVPSSSKSRP